MGKKDAPPPPDYTPIAMAAQSQQAASDKQLEVANRALDVQSAQADRVFNATSAQGDRDYKLQNDALDWAKGAYNDTKSTNDRIINFDMDQQNRALAVQEDSAANARKAQARYENTYQPLEDQAVQEARTYDSPDRREQQMGAASASVAQSIEQARHAATQNLESYGVNPASTRYAAMDMGVRIQGAAQQAAAANTTGQQVDATARGLRANAINVGRGLPSDINAGNQTALAGVNAGVGAGGAAGSLGIGTMNAGGANMGTAPQYGSMGTSAYGVGGGAISAPNGALNAGTGAINAGTGAVNAWGGAVHSGYQDQLGQFNANQSASSGFGQALGLAAGFIPGLAEGGTVPGGSAVPAGASPTGGQAIDDVPARLTPGEFVVPRDVVQWKGEEFFQKLAEQSRKARGSAPAKPTPMAVPAQAPTFTGPSALPVR